MSLADIQSAKTVKLINTLIKNTSTLAIGKNMFDKCKVISDKSVDGSNGNLTDNSLFVASDYIAVSPNTNYYKTTTYSHAYYDSNKIFISGVIGANGVNAFTTPNNCAYVRVSTTKVSLNIFQMEKGNSSTTYEPYKLIIQGAGSYIDVTNSIDIKPTMYTGLTMSTLGDSITNQFKWQPIVQSALHFAAINNYGVSGTKIADTGSDTTAMCRDERINAIDLNSDLIVVMGGMNDWAQSVPLGTITDTGTNTFYGGVKTMLQKLINRFPSKQIILMTTTYGTYPNHAGWADTSGEKNSLNLSTGDYSAITKEVATLYGITVADVYNDLGWNKNNITIFNTNDGTYIHPNSYGAARLANSLIKTLKLVEPQR